jgi:ribosome-interacting GTPase 1
MASLNAGPEFYIAQEKYSNAKTPEDKLEALREMYRLAPKHKASENLLKDITTKIGKINKEIGKIKREKSRKKEKAEFKKEGVQTTIIGIENSGKTALFNALSGQKNLSSPTPFETKKLIPGTMKFENIKIQLIDTPSATEANLNQILNHCKNSELVIMLVDETNESAFQEFILRVLNENKIKKIVLKPKKDLTNSSDEKSYNVYESGDVEKIKRLIFNGLNIIRIYTKPPHGKPDYNEPIILNKGDTVKEAAAKIHKEMINFKSVKMWGSTKFPGQQVTSDYKPQDGDLIEVKL